MTSAHLKFLLAAAVVAGSQGAMAQNVYGEVGYSALSTKLSVPVIGLAATAKPSMVRGLIGVSPFGGLNIEGIVAGSLSDDRFSIDVGNRSSVQLGRAKVNQILGAYIGTKIGLGPVEVFGRAGWAQSEVHFSGLGKSDTSDFSYGAGIRLIPGGNFTVSADYMNYLNKGGARIDGYTLSVGYRF